MKKSDKTYETSDSEAEINSKLRYYNFFVCIFMFFCGKMKKKNSEIEMVYRKVEKINVIYFF